MRLKDLRKISETASCGSTSAGNVASLVGNMGTISRNALGVGFDPEGNKGIYQDVPKKQKKTKKK